MVGRWIGLRDAGDEIAREMLSAAFKLSTESVMDLGMKCRKLSDMFINIRKQSMPLLKSEWVGCAEERPVGAVKGGRSPAKRTLDGDRGTLQSSSAECGIVRHSAMEARARGCRTNCLKPPSALPNRG